VVPAKCPFGYDSNNTFKLGPLSCVVCHALLHQSSKCTPCSHKFCKCVSYFNSFLIRSVNICTFSLDLLVFLQNTGFPSQGMHIAL
jgi:hypothetical protein